MAKTKAFLSVFLMAFLVGGLAVIGNLQLGTTQTSSEYLNDWPMFHYDSAHTGYTTTQALTTSPVVIWSTPSAEAGSENSPAIANGIVYASSQDLQAYNASTGDLIWDVGNGGGGANPIVNGNIAILWRDRLQRFDRSRIVEP